ncbi:Retrovirus-related Pol polyprotein from transposon RE1 [Vitis vinifera]|uniref:Retrovirus-related Pol polyprotein from transposon RE1 n=1 Tax=Vitis vinifera TaxID=29760 RepID=A0A438K5M6_VITVI|nr:Retrovirus-related Pol polyprotein from transposon RE1 [Vitis vinifera]
MTTKSSIFSSIISGSPIITSEKLVGSENYLSWSSSVELWFIGQGYEDHLVTQEADIPEAKGLYTNDIQRLYKVASSIVNVRQQDMDLATYIGQIASLKEEFLTVMPLTTDVGDQRIQIDKFFMVLTLIGLRPDLETVRDQILGSSSVPSLDDVFARLLLVTEVKANVLIAPIAISLATLVIGGISLTDSEYDDYLRYQATKSASVASIAQIGNASVAQTGNASACLTHTSSLGPWIVDSGAFDHISSIGLTHPLPSLPLTSVLYTPECSFKLISISKITRTLNCSITFSDKFVTLQDRSTGKTIDIGRESQGLYHLTSPSTPAVCISTYAPLLIHSRLGHPNLSKFQKMVPRFHLCCRLRDKLFAKATKCIFLGYSRLQKGYRCYSFETHYYFLSADVLFFEDSPFFSTSESFPVSEILLLPIISPPDAVPSRLLQVYHRRHRVAVPHSLAEVPADSLSIPSASPAPALPPFADLPIAFWKGWRQAMVDEMTALHSNDTLDLVVLPSGKSIVDCRWVYTVKVSPNGQVDRLKARLVAKGYAQVYGSDYGDTFSLVAKIASVRLLLSMAAMRFWPLYQLDIKNAFLHGDLAEEVYMEQPPGFVAQGESGVWHVSQYSRPFRFYRHNSSGQCIYLTKDLGKLKYFLGIEIAQSSSSVVLFQMKYALDILEETGMLDCKPVDTPMDPNVKLISGQGEPLGDPRRYRRFSPCDSHWDVVIRIIRYIKSTPGQCVLYENRGHIQVVGYTDADWAGSPTDRCSTSGYCVFIGGNIISWKSKKQDVVARSSAEVEYRAMALATCEFIWLKHLLRELRFGKDE